MRNSKRNIDVNLDDKNKFNALKLLWKVHTTKSKKETIWKTIQELFEDWFTVYSPDWKKRITSKLLMQVFWKVASKMKPLDFITHWTWRPEHIEKVVSDWIKTVLTEWGYDRCLRDKLGAFHKLILFWDAFIQIWLDEQSDYPIKFRTLSLSNVYIDSWATNLRHTWDDNSATKVVVIYRYSTDQFNSFYWDKLKKKQEITNIFGKIPRYNSEYNRLEMNQEDEQDIEDDIVEVAHYYDIWDSKNPKYFVYAWTSMIEIDSYESKMYPFYKDWTPFIPIIHFLCFPSTQWFYNHWIWELLYDLALINAQLNSDALKHSDDNINPISIINVWVWKSQSFFNKIKEAEQTREKWGKWYVPIENDNWWRSVSSEKFNISWLTWEWERIFNRLDREITRLWFNIDAVDRWSNLTATQIMAEEENADWTVLQIMEYNASESKFIVEYTMEVIKEYISKTNKIPLNLTVDIEDDEWNVFKPEWITLWDLADELKKFRYFVEINSRSWAIPSWAMEQAKLSRALQFTPPWTPAFNKLAYKWIKWAWFNIKPSDLWMEWWQEAPWIPWNPLWQNVWALPNDLQW